MSYQSQWCRTKITVCFTLLAMAQMLSACSQSFAPQPQSSPLPSNKAPSVKSPPPLPEPTAPTSIAGISPNPSSNTVAPSPPSSTASLSSSATGNPTNTSSGVSASDSFGSGMQTNGSSLSGNVSDVESALQDLGAKTVGNEIRVNLPADVLFDFDKATIRPDAAVALTKLLTIVKAQKSNGTIRIEGHTDAIGSEIYNQRLSERRAIAVKTWLVNQGIATTRLQAKGFGELIPVSTNTKPDGSDNPSGRQKNRRVQVAIET